MRGKPAARGKDINSVFKAGSGFNHNCVRPFCQQGIGGGNVSYKAYPIARNPLCKTHTYFFFNAYSLKPGICKWIKNGSSVPTHMKNFQAFNLPTKFPVERENRCFEHLRGNNIRPCLRVYKSYGICSPLEQTTGVSYAGVSQNSHQFLNDFGICHKPHKVIFHSGKHGSKSSRAHNPGNNRHIFPYFFF